jgi:hypothetical protein
MNQHRIFLPYGPNVNGREQETILMAKCVGNVEFDAGSSSTYRPSVAEENAVRERDASLRISPVNHISR